MTEPSPAPEKKSFPYWLLGVLACGCIVPIVLTVVAFVAGGFIAFNKQREAEMEARIMYEKAMAAELEKEREMEQKKLEEMMKLMEEQKQKEEALRQKEELEKELLMLEELKKASEKKKEPKAKKKKAGKDSGKSKKTEDKDSPLFGL